MKKTIFFTLALGLLSLSAYEVNFTKSFSKKVSPDTLSTYISINVNKKDEIKVAKVLDKFNNFFKEITNVKVQNGRYSISPRYKYLKDETKFVGYSGSLNYTIKSQSAKKLNDFISKLISKKESINSDDVKLEVSNVTWEVSQKLYNENTNDLRLKTILWANDYAKKLSKKLKTTCKLKVIDVNSNGRNINYYRNSAPMALSKRKVASFASTVTPIKSDENIVINSSFSLECK